MADESVAEPTGGREFLVVAHTGREIVHAIFPPKSDGKTAKIVPLARARKAKSSENAVPIRGLIPGMALHFAGCCHPLPGERIVGIVTTGKGVTVAVIDTGIAGRKAGTGQVGAGLVEPPATIFTDALHALADTVR